MALLKLKNGNVGPEFFEEFNKMLDKFPAMKGSAEAQLIIGYYYITQKKYDEGIQLILKNLRLLKPGALKTDFEYKLGMAFYSKTPPDYRKAAGYFLTVSNFGKVKNLIPGAKYMLGFCFEGLKDYKRARETYNDLVKTAPASEFKKKAEERLQKIPR